MSARKTGAGDIVGEQVRLDESGLAAGAPALELSGIEKRYKTRRRDVLALSGVELTVPRGSFVTLVGPSGCGKSTALKMAAGLVRPTSGVVRLNGEPVTEPGADIGMMFQQSVLLPWRSVLDNVLLPVDIRRRSRDEYTPRARELLAQVDLADFENHRPRELSGGMQQRVAICRALINDPPVLLLDEPFGALDSITREQLNDLLLKLCAQTRKTTVLVTHDIDEAVYLADKVVVMSPRPGRIIKQLDIRLPRPRDYTVRRLPNFEEYATEVRRLLGMVTAGPLDGESP